MYGLSKEILRKRQHLIEWRAGQIADPVERLRFLRRNMPEEGSTPPAVVARALQLWQTRRMFVALGFTCFVLLALAPGHTKSRPQADKGAPPVTAAPTPAPVFAPMASREQKTQAIWLVETRDGVETYSNGLRIDDKYATANEPRGAYPVYAYSKPGEEAVAQQSEPAGIVFHTTESLLAPFDPKANRQLQRIGKEVLNLVVMNRSYHFVIDRFGRVFRIVKESDVANHSGYSVWGDEKGLYVNLNRSFLGIAFETTIAPHQLPSATEAQITSGRVLTEMLRAKYGIATGNCVTHAQVSVNPDNYRIGYHTDWAGSFPFAELGLPDNYLVPPPSMYAFGFGYDALYVQVTGDRVWQGLLTAEERVQRQAGSANMAVPKYITALHHRYRQIIAALKIKSSGKEKDDET